MLLTRGLFGPAACAALLACAAMFAYAGSAGAQTSAATCSTFNATNEPASRFDAGDEIIVRGTGFGAKSLVFVRFEQGARTAELARADANDLGAFTSPKAKIPGAIVDGAASIIALDARGSATCEITVIQAAADEDGDLGGLYLVWGSALAIFGVILAVLTYRRWKAERLREAMDRIGRRDRSPGRPGRKEGRAHDDDLVGAWELDPWESGAVERSPDERVRSDVEPEQPDAVTFPIGPDPIGPEALDDDGEDDDEDLERWSEPEDDAPSTTKPDEGVNEPPRLPDGWDSGRLRPNRQASDAIERLRREVRTWGRS